MLGRNSSPGTSRPQMAALDSLVHADAGVKLMLGVLLVNINRVENAGDQLIPRITVDEEWGDLRILLEEGHKFRQAVQVTPFDDAGLQLRKVVHDFLHAAMAPFRGDHPDRGLFQMSIGARFPLRHRESAT